jgi:uncharacterized Fe-S radical SAM superfamily protein PflX
MAGQRECELVKQGFQAGKCTVKSGQSSGRACDLTLKIENDIPFRLISSAHLSRPEHYFSIYQSGCNMDCLKCHSWNFSQHVDRGGEKSKKRDFSMSGWQTSACLSQITGKWKS